MMNVIQVDREWAKKFYTIPDIKMSTLLTNYALKDFRLIAPTGSYMDFKLGELDLDSYGTHSAIFFRGEEDKGWYAALCDDSDLFRKFFDAGIGFQIEGEKTTAIPLGKDEMRFISIWFVINHFILKKYKTVIKMGKRRRQIQDMGEKRANAYHQKPIKISDGISYTWEYENPRSFNRHCEAWGVRGHYRHYKNGKVVFIHPYIKGSGRLKDSLYEL